MPRWAYLAALTPGLLGLAGLWLGGPWLWAVPVYLFVLVPLVELVWTGSDANLPEAAYQQRTTDPFFDVIAYATLPLLLGALVILLVQVSAGAYPTWGSWLGAVMSVGMLCGVYGLNVGHELCHRSGRAPRLVGQIFEGATLYAHFFVEHNWGHHVRVATPDDPASARRGEWLYPFWLRSIVGGFRSAWRLQPHRVALGLAVQGALVALVAVALGPAAAGTWLAAALVGVLLLETVNYLEHYGLQRRPTGERGRDGRPRYETVRPRHSWNANHPLGRALLLDLTRHSDHHAHSSRPYPALRHMPEAPQLPTGYPALILLALVPPLFFAVMDPHVEQAEAGEKRAA